MKMVLNNLPPTPNPHLKLLGVRQLEKLHDIRVAAKDLIKHIGDNFYGSIDSDEFFQAYDNLTVCLAQYDAIWGNKKK